MAYPPPVLAALGEFDLDPCSSLNRPWDTAKHHYTIEDDGLKQDRCGRVWFNPPDGTGIAPFLKKMVAHKHGIVLLFAITETKAFFEYVWAEADAIMFLKGRLKFHFPDGKQGGTAGSPSVLIAYGQNNVEALENSGLEGKIVYLNK
jgi:hypothetical protein